jgi:hypothetical protein
MKKVHLFLLLSLVLTLSSCGAARYYAGFTPGAAKEGMVVLGPSSVQYYIDKQNKEAYDDSLSTASESLIATILEELNLPVTQRVQLDSVQKEEAIAFMRFITAQDKELRGDYPIPDLFDELLESKGERYGLLIYADGMTRDTKGFAKEVAKGVLLGVATAVLTMGAMSVYGTSVSSVSHIYVAILDSETDRVVFYNSSVPQESHPLKHNPVRMQLEDIFKDFLKQ